MLNALQITNADISAGANISFSKINSTNITLTKPTIDGSIQALTTDSYAGTTTLDLSASNIHTIVLAGNVTIALTNVSVGQPFVIRVTQSSGGSNTISWFSTIEWDNGTAPVLTATANKTDVYGFLCTSAGNYDGFLLGANK